MACAWDLGISLGGCVAEQGTAATGSSRVGCFRFSVAEEEEMGDSSIRGGFRSHGRTATGFDN
jgi:hypothetical protein